MAGWFGRIVYRDPRWPAVRARALNRDGWRCRQCGRPGVLEVHHVKALAEGGEPYALANLRTVCVRCHLRAHRSAGVPGRAEWRAAVHGV